MVRHADAHRTTIRARATIDDVELEVTDDGRGASGRDGAGLSGMRERVSAFGGDLTAAPTPEGGYAVAATLCFEEATA